MAPGKLGMRFVRGELGLLGVALTLLLGGSTVIGHTLAACHAAVETRSERPNVVMVVTDDLDVDLWHKLDLFSTIGGREFTNSFVTSTVCCPSRTSELTGLYAHNHHVLGTFPPNGGLYAARKYGVESCMLPVWLQQAGYYTGYMGRYLVGYGWRDSRGTYVPPGWNRWIGRTSKTSRGYQNVRFSFDGRVRRTSGDEGELYLAWVRQFIGDAGDQPFFAVIAPMAPHGPWGGEGRYPGDPARRAGTLAPIEKLVTTLLDEVPPNTYLIFTSDNGFHLLPKPGKSTPYDADSRVPLVVVGPGVLSGRDEHFALNIDLAPTIAELAGVEPPYAVDGRSLGPLLRAEDPAWRTSFIVELPAFRAVRTTDDLYVTWSDGRRETVPVH